ncbi:metallophosphoesterase [Pseudomonas cichorii]|uniref:Metallophosphoesterase n=1 Tax=Pseudomonas lijiangensis TaxID=2995658 RepID=A0ABX8HV07_9PSED|nr:MULTISPECIES: metallophosphoesterase [Pseudomonas syringae group]MBX8492162.1 metallophosphoesterase [Pseudomonas cichorii]MBX8502591.1 metallophosphoesterase [Pseudomonas lijiangensis]MBX8507539.1 metallophosphoesterase [Pseudomonas lijiangensis]MBX8512308.1 metallophosphoesterase [Pseudomonas cichorii]MBX8527289.1 metallophosphoesterase [Pseudomonas cichorii]
MNSFRHFDINVVGRDFAVGDIHGHFARLQGVLDEIGFDKVIDRLFCTGNLIDRGPQSHLSVEWLEQPWFFSVQGSHEALAIEHVEGQPLDYQKYVANGASWFLELSDEKQLHFAERFYRMPLALEVETADGLIGIVHACCPLPTWDLMSAVVREELPGLSQLRKSCLWSRMRLRSGDTSGIPDLRALIVGHTLVRQPEVLGNVFHIDTGGWQADGSGYFTILELDTLYMHERK